MNLGSIVNVGDILTEQQLRGRDPQVLIRLGLAEYVKDATPIAPSQSTLVQREEAYTPPIEVEEVAPAIEERKSDKPIKAELEKRGVWFQAFVNGMKVYSSRDEKQTKRWIKEYNEKLLAA